MSVTDEGWADTDPAETPSGGVDPALLATKKRLQLSRADVVRRLSAARAEAHREILRRALEALDAEIAATRS